jgi:hypothetical protein
MKNLNPWFLTGFSDAESTFQIRINPNNKYSTGWVVQAVFQITLHEKDLELLKSIKAFFKGVGKINRNGRDAYQYRVYSMKDLAVIIAHFDKYPLISQKQIDYILFKQIFELISRKEHLTTEGLKKIVSIRASLNLGLSDSLKVAFPNIIPVSRPQVKLQKIPNPNWLAGFISGEGCFLVNLFKSLSCKFGFQVKLEFSVSQNSRDSELLGSFSSYLGCGNVSLSSTANAVNFRVTGIADLTDKILPFFFKYPIEGVKAKDFDDFCKVAELMRSKVHLTSDGLEQIRKIKSGMNRGRDS